MQKQTHKHTQKTQQQTQWKGIFMGICILAVIGYIASVILTKEESSVPNASVISSEARNPASFSDTHSGIETDTGKRLITLVNSGTNWGMSPFGSGKPLEDKKEEKPKFMQPNTEWKTRTLSGITYVFGEGNPREVALSEQQLKDFMKKCGTESDPNNEGYLCKEGDGYVTPEVEKYLKAALSDPNWETLLTRCEENLRYGEENLAKPIPTIYDSKNPIVTYPIIAYTDFLDINKWIIIGSSERKELDWVRLFYLQSWLENSFQAHWIQYEWPIHTDGSKWNFKNPNCVDAYGADIMRNLILARVTYMKTGRKEDM